MTQNELIQYVKERIKSIGPGENKITGELLQDVLLTLIANTWSTAGGSGITTCSFSFGNGDLDNNYSVTLEHQLSTVLPGILVFNDKGEQLGESYYTATVIDANTVTLTFYQSLPEEGTFKAIFIYYIDDVKGTEGDYLEYLEESFSLFTGEAYQETPYGWSIVNTTGENFGADFAIEEDSGALKISITRDSLPADTGTLWQLGIKSGKVLKAGETYRVSAELKCTDPGAMYLFFVGVVNEDTGNQFENAASFSPIIAVWKEFTQDITPVEDGNLKIVCKFYSSWDMTDIYIDNLKVEKIS